MFFSVITKNLNREILTNNLITFKRWDRVKNEKIHYYVGSLKNPIFREGVQEKPIYKGELPKKGNLNSLHIQGEGLEKKRRRCFKRGLIPQFTLCSLWYLNDLGSSPNFNLINLYNP